VPVSRNYDRGIRARYNQNDLPFGVFMQDRFLFSDPKV